MQQPAQGYDVSISDEKPLHMRRRASLSQARTRSCFNLRREAAPHATAKPRRVATYRNVSISDEKPLHMRPAKGSPRGLSKSRFNLRREAAPHATVQGGTRQRAEY